LQNLYQTEKNLIVMLITSIVLFALAAVVGLVLINQLMKGSTNKTVAVAHGVLAAAALGILIYFAATAEGSSPVASIVLFVVAALGGFVLFFRDLMGKPGPIALAFVHAGAAVVAFVLLLSFAFGS
jgi:FtsH-binding integral membrane protein